MYFNLSPDYLAQVKVELKEQFQLYREAIKKDEPFAVVKSIQKNIKYLRDLIRDESLQSEETSSEKVL